MRPMETSCTRYESIGADISSPSVVRRREVAALLFRLARGWTRHPRSADVGAVACGWMEEILQRRGGSALLLDLRLKKLLLVGSPALSAHILEHAPARDGYIEGPTKKKAMSFLAGEALTVTHDAQWRRLRGFNEAVLARPADGAEAQADLLRVRRAFAAPVRSVDDLRARMSRAMLPIVFGDVPTPPHLADDVQRLFGMVQSPPRRILAGGRGRRRRERFYRELGEAVHSAAPPSLVARALRAREARADGEALSETELLQQVPHWMFTFTGSATDLLVRALALVAARPAIHREVTAEIRAAGGAERVEAVDRLRLLEACLLEAGRLFPPVTKTFHAAPLGAPIGPSRLPSDVEIVHYFPFLHRRSSAGDPARDDFAPHRWLEPGAGAAYSGTFLSGARRCPGRDLALFACKSAAALLLERGVAVDGDVLSRDPLPVSFPSRVVRLRFAEPA
jgi:cytochrome P450